MKGLLRIAGGVAIVMAVAAAPVSAQPPTAAGHIKTVSGTATIVRDRTRLAAALKGAGGARDFAGTYELSLATPQLAIGRIQLGDVAADLGGPFNLTRNGIELRLANDHRVTAKRATIARSGFQYDIDQSAPSMARPADRINDGSSPEMADEYHR